MTTASRIAQLCLPDEYPPTVELLLKAAGLVQANSKSQYPHVIDLDKFYLYSDYGV